MFASGAVAVSVSSTVPSKRSRTRRVITTLSAVSPAMRPSTTIRARSGTPALGPTTTTSTLPWTSARAISLATGWP